MSDQGNVATEDTLNPRNEISVVTEENEASLSPPNTPAAPADDQQSQTPGESASSETDQKQDDPPKPPRNRRQEREVRKLKKQLADERSGREADAARIAELEAKVAGLEPKPQQPKLKDFDTPEQFADAYAKWKADTAEPAAKPPEPKTSSTPPPEPTGLDPFAEERAALHDAGLEKHGDAFMEAMEATGEDTVPISLDMRDYLFENPDLGADMFMHFAENREEALKISQMGPRAAARELNKIAKQLQEAPPEKDGEITVQETRQPHETKQPEPPNTVKTPAAPTTPDPNQMTMDEYSAHRKAQMKATGQRF